MLLPPPKNMEDARADEWDRALGLQAQSPGQNAWAKKKFEEHQFRLETNAFYQRKFSAEEHTEPTAIHPAFRTASHASNTSVPPLSPMLTMPSADHTAPRDSNVTTMSVFVRADQEVASPPLNLHTTPQHTPQPTQRGFIEEQKEHQKHLHSGSTAERTPVFRPTPKLQSDEFGQVKPSTGKKGLEVKFADAPISLPTKSPKKSLFGRFFGTAKNAPPMPSENIPPKAEQILGEKTVRRGLGRSPSKPKGIFKRRLSDAGALQSPGKVGVQVEEPSRPHTAMSMNHNSMSSRGSLTKRVGTEQSNGTAPLISRTQSLKYMNSGVPPTPPSKDTPPDEKAVRNVSHLETPIIPFDNNTPTKSTGFVSTDKDLSPTKIGSYGYRAGASLVTQPSMHSMRASVVPNAMDPADFEEAKLRIEGLGIEGFSMPSETRRQNQASYSPSVYSPEWGRRSVATFPERIEERKEEEEAPSPSMKMVDKGQLLRDSFNTTTTNCTSATIHVALDKSGGEQTPTYPELVKDTSIVDFMRYTSPPADDTSKYKCRGEVTPRRIDGSIDEKLRSTARLFASDEVQACSDSPMSHHTSAQVSPLHLNPAALETLPATTYKPPVTPFSKQKQKQSDNSMKHRKSHSISAVYSYGSPESKRHSPARDLLERRPMLSKQLSPSWKEQRPIYNGDPQKPPSNVDLTKSIGQMSLSCGEKKVKSSNGLEDFSNSMGSMYPSREKEQKKPSRATELSNSIAYMPGPLDEQHPRPSKYQKTEHVDDNVVEVSDTEAQTTTDPGRKKKQKKKRISTLHAHEFYRNSPDLNGSTKSRTSEASTIIQTPNLPPDVIATRNGSGHHTSSGLEAMPAPDVPRAPSRPQAQADESAEPTTADLMALIQQQQYTIQQMMMKMQKMENK